MTQPPHYQQPGQPTGPPPPYDPYAAPPVMGAPGPSGHGPPPMPPRKSNTGLILVLVLGVVVLLGAAGAGVWFFLLGGPGSDQADQQLFPDFYHPTVVPSQTESDYVFTRSEGYDICPDLELDGVKKVMPLDGSPDGETESFDDGTGAVSCAGQLRSDVEHNGSSPAGTFSLDLIVFKDTASATSAYTDMWDDYGGYETVDAEQLAEKSKAVSKHENNVTDVVVGFRNGDLTGLASFSINHTAEHPPPDAKMLAHVLVDVANSGMNTLPVS